MKNLWFGKPGLGPNAFGIFRYLLPYHNLFHDAAVRHDLEGYAIGGDEIDREDADATFLLDMLSACDNSFQAKFAFIYYNLVRQYGYLFFNFHIDLK